MASPARAAHNVARSPEAAIRSLVPTGDPKDDHEPTLVVDQIDDPQVTDPQTPVVTISQPGRPWLTLDPAQREDRTPQARRIASVESSELTLGVTSQLDAIRRALRQSRSGP
jgi:hypothetical protein